MKTEEIKDLLNNSKWTHDMLSYRFVSDTLHLAAGIAGKYEIVEKDGNRFIEFENQSLRIVDVNESSLTLNDGKVDFTLYRV
jgi:hypothetical protein